VSVFISPMSSKGPATALDRAAIRAQAVARFGRERMVDAYIDAYEAVTHERR
jgi:hypothetical protein